MTVETPKESLLRSLQAGRDAMLWKLDGMSEYDARRPLTPTGSNVLGIVKHLCYVELGYFVETFGRPLPVPSPWHGEVDDDPHADLVATAEESRDDVVGLYHLAWEEAARTFDALDPDAVGRVPHWPEGRNEVTLHQMLVWVVAETHRHAGHVDILRETVDGLAGHRPDVSNLPGDYDWPAHVRRVEEVALLFR
jgi:hypothetical protein